ARFPRQEGERASLNAFGWGSAAVAVEDVAQAAQRVEDRTLPLAPPTGLRSRRVDAARQPTERERLDEDAARSGEGREEESLSSEQHRLHSPDELDVVADLRFERDQASGVDPQRLTGRQILGDDMTARVHEREAVSFQLLQDESFPAEKSGAELA